MPTKHSVTWDLFREYGVRSAVRHLWLRARIGVIRMLIGGRPLLLGVEFRDGITIAVTDGTIMVDCTIGTPRQRPPPPPPPAPTRDWGPHLPVGQHDAD